MIRVEGICFKEKEKGWKEEEEVFLNRISKEKGIPIDYSFITSKGNKKKSQDQNKGFCHDRFNANFVLDGLNVEEVCLNDKMVLGEAEVEVTEVGKECHEYCPVLSAVEPCALGKHIFFGRVVKEGFVRKNDYVRMK
jgi:MOSC domain-containing protein YiiM